MGGLRSTCPPAPSTQGQPAREVVPPWLHPHRGPTLSTLNSVKQHINQRPVQMSAGTSARFKKKKKNDHHASSYLAVWSPPTWRRVVDGLFCWVVVVTCVKTSAARQLNHRSGVKIKRRYDRGLERNLCWCYKACRIEWSADVCVIFRYVSVTAICPNVKQTLQGLHCH